MTITRIARRVASVVSDMNYAQRRSTELSPGPGRKAPLARGHRQER